MNNDTGASKATLEEIEQQIELIEEEKNKLINKAYETGLYPDEQIKKLDDIIKKLMWEVTG